MRTDLVAAQPDFGAFCAAVRSWLTSAPAPDAALAAALHVLDARPLAVEDLEQLRATRDARAALGARTLLSLWWRFDVE